MERGRAVALLVFYRAHVQAGNTAVFDAMLAALSDAGLNTVAVAVDSLKNPASLALLQSLAAQHQVGVVLNATSFAMSALDGDDVDSVEGAQMEPLAGDAPVLQLITAGCSQEQWQADPHGLAPRDLAMQVVLPEVDGRIGTRAISFKGLAWRCERTEVDVVRYQPEPERMAFVAELARRWCVLRAKPNTGKRVALILANYPNDDARLANGVGLDTPASTVALLRAMQDAGYATGDLARGRRRADRSAGGGRHQQPGRQRRAPRRPKPGHGRLLRRLQSSGRSEPRSRQCAVGCARAGPHGAQRPLHGVGPSVRQCVCGHTARAWA
jgi:cobaltochelatase CobN